MYCTLSPALCTKLPQIIFFPQSVRIPYGPEADTASERNEYQCCLLRGKGGLCIGLHVLIVQKFLKP